MILINLCLNIEQKLLENILVQKRIILIHWNKKIQIIIIQLNSIHQASI